MANIAESTGRTNNWAIIVGINHYEFLSKTLQFAYKDALSMQKFLTNEMGFEESKVLVLGDGSEGEFRATRTRLRDNFLGKLPLFYDADNFLFFFSGHSLLGVDREDYLLPVDGNPYDLYETGISIKFFTDCLRSTNVSNIVFIFDICRTSVDSERNDFRSIENHFGGLPYQQKIYQMKSQQNFIKIFSCDAGEISFESALLQQGIFTYALIEGLRKSKKVKDLVAYLKQRVRELNQAESRTGNNQTPVVIPEQAFQFEKPILSGVLSEEQTLELIEIAVNSPCDSEFQKSIFSWGDIKSSQPAIEEDQQLLLEYFTHLRNAAQDIRVVQQAISKSARAYALNRSLGSLTLILNKPEVIPEAGQNLIIYIARSWRSLLLKTMEEIGNLAITQPVQNPYTIGDPVLGDRFIGRDDIMRQLEELWFMNKLPQSIVLYGHRRMGKTSILRNIAARLGADTRIAYINLNLCEICTSIGEVLLTLTDELAKVTTVPKPTDADLLNLPEITFRRYISAIATTNQKLIIILDEFETLETLISTGKISPDFLAYLRGLIQLSPTIAFAFAGLHTLEEMTADYFKPFFASILPVRVGFLDRSATRQLLANPDPDSPLDFAPDLLDEAHALTNGQPYLIQLIGFHLTRLYNTQVFEQSRSRDAKFTLDDLTTILDNPDFYSSGRYYFTGVWNQAAEQLPQQQPILAHLAHHPGQTVDQIAQTLNLDRSLIQIALDTLKRHDVAHHTDNDRWEISIDLFRRWLVRHRNCK